MKYVSYCVKDRVADVVNGLVFGKTEFINGRRKVWSKVGNQVWAQVGNLVHIETYEQRSFVIQVERAIK